MTDRTKPRKTNNSPIARLRMERGLTQAQLAEMVGVSGNQLSRWELGSIEPRGSMLIKLAKALGCSAEDLV